MQVKSLLTKLELSQGMVNGVFKVALIAYCQTLILLCLTPESDRCRFGKMSGSLWQSKSADPRASVCIRVCARASVCNSVLCVFCSDRLYYRVTMRSEVLGLCCVSRSTLV